MRHPSVCARLILSPPPDPRRLRRRLRPARLDRRAARLRRRHGASAACGARRCSASTRRSGWSRDNPRVLQQPGGGLRGDGEFDKALEYYQKALQAAPDNRELRANYARFVEFYQAFKPKRGARQGPAPAAGRHPRTPPPPESPDRRRREPAAGAEPPSPAEPPPSRRRRRGRRRPRPRRSRPPATAADACRGHRRRSRRCLR